MVCYGISGVVNARYRALKKIQLTLILYYYKLPPPVTAQGCNFPLPVLGNRNVADCLSEAPHVFTAVRMVCNFRTLAGGIVLVGSGLALRSCSSFEEYSDAFNKVVLPAFTKLVELSESSLCFTVLAETPSALKELWNIYNNEKLKNRLQSFLVTEEIKQLVKGEEMEVTVYIDEKEYRAAYLDLMFQQNHG